MNEHEEKAISIVLSVLFLFILCSCGNKSQTTASLLDSGVGTDGKVDSGDGASPGWAEYFEAPATSYNNDLALMAAILSDKAEDSTGEGIENQYASYDINSCRTYNYTSGTEIFDIELAFEGGAFGIGQRTLDMNGVDTTILFITARGSKTLGEFAGDLWKGWYLDPDKVHPFLDRTVWDNVYDFEEKLWEGLDDYLDAYPDIRSAENLKILITGHSLGGAAANLLGARFTDGVGSGEWWGDKVLQEDIYVYTFGTIKVLTVEDNASSGYQHIHNIYNHYDSFGPNGNLGFTGASSINAKFGHTEEYSNDHTEDVSGGNLTINHNMSSYISDLENNRILNAPCERCGGTKSCLYSSENADSGSQEQPESTAVPDDPTDQPDSFSIEGTWKNVGDTTFGQAQPGSIITFDGTHCNYYSPCDTYVFYYENGQWSLECVSYIFSETLRFRVDIIDEDNMNIFYGSDAVHLNRISRKAEAIEESRNDFTIEGSWVSRGAYGFGQAQPGSTVSFDGAHCNFYSPYDTYAFYQEDGKWKLECTSVLFSETLTFTVEVIDSDTINIYYGSTCTELHRTN